MAGDEDCPVQEHSVSSLPYWLSHQTFPCMYAGTFKTSDSANHYLFYWFFKTIKPNAPLVVWLNGGPGFSSIWGLFVENGPITISREGSESDYDNFVVQLNPEGSWADEANIVFVDQPVGTGFAYGTPL